MTKRVAVLCWEESRPWVSALRQSGYSVPWVEEPKNEVHRQVSAVEADLLLVDLTRSVDEGINEVALMADAGTLSGVPIVAVTHDGNTDGLADKIADLTVTTPEKMIAAVESALAGRRK